MGYEGKSLPHSVPRAMSYTARFNKLGNRTVLDLTLMHNIHSSHYHN